MSNNFPRDGVSSVELRSGPSDVESQPGNNGKAHANSTNGDSGATRKALKLSTVSHTLDAQIAERLRHFAFRERISESAVIEFSLRAFFDGDNDSNLGQQLRDQGAGLRRKS